MKRGVKEMIYNYHRNFGDPNAKVLKELSDKTGKLYYLVDVGGDLVVDGITKGLIDGKDYICELTSYFMEDYAELCKYITEVVEPDSHKWSIFKFNQYMEANQMSS